MKKSEIQPALDFFFTLWL